MLRFPHYLQPDKMACGATCLRIIAKHYGKNFSIKDLLQISETTREGANLQGLSNAAEKIGFRTLGVKVSFSKLEEEAPLPCIAYWNQSHFIVVYKIKKNKIYVSDPAHGLLVYSKEDFLKNWVSDGKDEGVLLLLETNPDFYSNKTEDQIKENKQSFSFMFRITSWKFITINISISYTKYRRYRYSKQRYTFYLFNSFCTTNGIFWQNDY